MKTSQIILQEIREIKSQLASMPDLWLTFEQSARMIGTKIMVKNLVRNQRLKAYVNGVQIKKNWRFNTCTFRPSDIVKEKEFMKNLAEKSKFLGHE